MSVIKIQLKNYAMLQLIECERHVASELSDHFTFEVAGAKYMPSVKRRQWDGKIRLLDRTTGQINAGLYHAIKDFAQKRNYTLELQESAYGYPTDKNKVNHLETTNWIQTLGIPFELQYVQVT